MNTANTVNINAATTKSLPFVVEAVGAPFLPPNKTVKGYPKGHKYMKYVPKKEEDQVLEKVFLIKYMSFHNNPGDWGFAVVGPTGCGKTTSIREVNHHLNIPTLTYTGDEETERSDLVGQMKLLTNPKTGQAETRFQFGILLKAYKLGFTFILEEFNLVPQETLKSLNELIRSDQYIVPETGELVKKNPMFRMVIVGNDWGRGFGNLREAGGSVSSSFLDRFMKHNMGYLSAEEETEIVARKLPNQGVVVAEKMVEVANIIRPMLVGIGKDESEASLDLDFSTRTLVGWADMLNRFSNADNPIKVALETILLESCAEHEKIVIHEIARNVFGSSYDG